MIAEQQLKALIVYDDERNEYTICNHNLDSSETTAVMNEWQPHLRSGCTFIVIDQVKHHETADVQGCRACRMDVRRVLSSKLSKTPKFKRRKQ